MFLAPHQIADRCNQIEAIAPYADATPVRWTWIAGRRFRGVRRL
jgi:hypothetical protein